MALTAAQVQAYYIGFYGRPADPVGLNYWITQDAAAAEAGFAASAEYVNLYAGMNAEQRVAQIYQNVLGRTADVTGLVYWAGELVAGRVTEANIITTMMQNALGLDVTTIEDRMTYAQTFTDALDTAEEIVAYSGTDAASAARTVMSTIKATAVDDHASLVAATAIVDDSVATVTEAGASGSGETYVFTAGVDNLVGTAGNDGFTATYADSNSDTLTLGDAISGGTGTDTLTIYSEDDDFGVSGLTISSVENLVVVNSDDNNWNDFNVAGRNFDSITMDVGDLTSSGLNVNNVLSSTAVTIQNVLSNGQTNNINFTADTTTTAAVQSITVQDVNLADNNTDEYFYAYADFTKATSLDLTLNVSNVYDGGTDNNSNLNYNVEFGTVENVAVNVTANITDVVTDDNFNLNINVSQAGGSVNTFEINITDSDNVYVDINTDDNNNGTSATDVITYNLDGVTNSNSYAYLGSTGFETININVLSDSNINGMFDNSQTIAGAQTINIDVAGDFSVDGNVTFNGTVGSVTMNITGTGDVALAGVSLGDGGATDTVTVDASALVGGLTMNDANGRINTISGGTGADDITVFAVTTAVSTGTGDDAVDMAGLDYGGATAKTLNGGDGTDTITINDGALLDSATAANISGFEVLDVSGAAGGDTYDMSVETGLAAVTGSGTLGSVTINNAAAGVTVALSATASTDTTDTALVYALKTATGTSDSLSLSLTSKDTETFSKGGGDKDGNLTVSAVTANAIETISISSNATTTDGSSATKAYGAGDYLNTISSLSADAVKTLTLTGAADLTITDVTATTLTKVDGSAMTGQLKVALDASATASVAVLGGSAADTFTMTNNSAANNILVGNGGGDSITLAAAGTKETVRLSADGDSVLTLTDTTVPVVSPVVYDTATGYDSVTTFTTGEDKIELSSGLGLTTGDARSAITGKGTVGDGTISDNAELADVLGDLIGTGADFFSDGVVDRAIASAILNDATDATLVFIDLNADGDFTNGTDGMIYLVGATTGVVISDVVFG